MEWKDIMLPALQTTSLILLCLVWFMIGKYRALCRRQKAEVFAVAGESKNAWIGMTESVGGVSREIQLNFDASMDKDKVIERMEALCWEFLRPFDSSKVEAEGEIHLN